MARQIPPGLFSRNLRGARKTADISQEELGFRCDLHRTEISLLERSLREPRLSTMVKLASALGIGVEALCEGIEWDVKRHRFEPGEEE
jgi:transcriptional regulator with XRE-family HTH domain